MVNFIYSGELKSLMMSLHRKNEKQVIPKYSREWRVTSVFPNTMPMSLGKLENVLPLTMVKPPLRSPPPCSIKPWVMPTGMSNVWTPYWAEKLPSWEEEGSARSSKWPTTSETASEGSESKEIGGISNSSSPKLGVWNVCRGKKRGQIISGKRRHCILLREEHAGY